MRRRPGLRPPAGLAKGKEPGAEAPSVNKLYWSEFHKRFGEIAIAIAGAGVWRRRHGAPRRTGYETDDWQDVFFSSRSGTIYSGDERDPAQHHRGTGARPAQRHLSVERK